MMKSRIKTLFEDTIHIGIVDYRMVENDLITNNMVMNFNALDLRYEPLEPHFQNLKKLHFNTLILSDLISLDFADECDQLGFYYLLDWSGKPPSLELTNQLKFLRNHPGFIGIVIEEDHQNEFQEIMSGKLVLNEFPDNLIILQQMDLEDTAKVREKFQPFSINVEPLSSQEMTGTLITISADHPFQDWDHVSLSINEQPGVELSIESTYQAKPILIEDYDARLPYGTSNAYLIAVQLTGFFNTGDTLAQFRLKY